MIRIPITGVNYGHSPENDLERALVFPDNTWGEMDKIYGKFIDDTFGEERFMEGYIAAPARDVLACDQDLNTEIDYKSAIIFGLYSLDANIRAMPDPEIAKLRNQHLNDFVEYLLKKEICVAEKIPVKPSEEEEAIMNRVEAN
jgi:hypothetical protein